MPTPFQHLFYADFVLNHPDLPARLRALLRRELGPFLLGTTATDVQSITGQARAETHFYRLSEGRNISPADKMLCLYPELAPPQTISPAHAAFITGYLVHLAWDVLWAWDIFVPFYRDAEQWPSRRDFFVHHNALRVWLDRTAYTDLRRDPGLPCLLQETQSDHWLPFVPDTALGRWRDWLVEQLGDPTQVQTAEVFSERLRVPVACLEDLVAEMESGRYTTVPGIEAALASYEAAALTESLRTILRYWGIERRLDWVPVTESVTSVT